MDTRTGTPLETFRLAPHPTRRGLPPAEPPAPATSAQSRREVYSLLNALAAKALTNQVEFNNYVPDGPRRVQTVNLHHLWLATRNRDFYDLIASADDVTADGWPLVWAIGQRNEKVERVTGSDYVLSLFSDDSAVRRIMLVGASEVVGDRFAELVAGSNLELVDRDHGRAADWNCAALAARANAASADLVLVAVTPPTGEYIAAGIREHLERGIVVAVGGAIDMVVGEQRRAPRAVQAIRMEWAWRLASNPGRLARRYLVECLPLFFTHLAPYRVAERAR